MAKKSNHVISEQPLTFIAYVGYQKKHGFCASNVQSMCTTHAHVKQAKTHLEPYNHSAFSLLSSCKARAFINSINTSTIPQ